MGRTAFFVVAALFACGLFALGFVALVDLLCEVLLAFGVVGFFALGLEVLLAFVVEDFFGLGLLPFPAALEALVRGALLLEALVLEAVVLDAARFRVVEPSALRAGVFTASVAYVRADDPIEDTQGNPISWTLWRNATW